MAFNSALPKQSFTASASQTEFNFNYKIFNSSDVLVYQTPSGNSPNDANDLLTETTHYTVSNITDNGFTVTLVTGAGVNDTIIGQRAIPVDRNVDYQQGGDMLSQTLDDDQDIQTYMIADQRQINQQSVRLPNTAVGISTQLPDVVADSYLKWDSAGTAIENDTSIPDSVTTSTDAALDAGSWANENEDVPVKEYTAGVPSDRAPTVYSAKHWAIKAQDAVIGDVEFRDTEWRVFDDLDNTKKVAFQVSEITTATTRTITMPDANVDLADVNNAVLKSGDQTVNGIKTFGSFPITPSSAPTTDYQVANKKYVDDNTPTLLGALDINNFFHAQDQKTSGTASGTATSGSYQTRILNTVVTNTISGASLSSNQVTLPAGDYYIEASAPAWQTNAHKVKLVNITDVADIAIGTSEYASLAGNSANRAFVSSDKFTLASAKVIQLQHRFATTSATNGLGISSSFGDIEVFADIKIWKVG